MGNGHSHSDGNMRRVILALILTACFMVVEVIGGILSGSLALLADAGHMLTDTMALGLAAVAFHVSKRPADRRLTFGYHRFQILAAFVNGLSLLLIVGWILFEAVQRFLSPAEVQGQMMLVVAGAGLVVNIAAFLILHGADRDNLNISAAVIHVAGDLLGSVAAIVAALVIIKTSWMMIDPILSVAVAMLILKSAWVLVKRSAHVLLEGAPEWLDVEDMQRKIIEELPGVGGIHHVHVWGLTPQNLMLTMHVCLEAEAANPTDTIRRVKNFLRRDYGIDHCTIELEVDECSDFNRQA